MKMLPTLLAAVGAAICLGATDAAAASSGVADTYYVLSFFLNNGEDGLHLATSRDGLAWRPVAGGRSLMRPTVGREKLVRDPSVVRGPDGEFHMVWTASWQDRVIGYAHSRDLVRWSAQRPLGVMEHEPAARNCWAPELFFDPKDKQYVILWSTTIPGRFPATDGQSEDRYNHRIYAATTRDFRTLSRPQLLFDPGHSVIDAFLALDAGKYLLFYKDETRFPEPKKIILLATADRAAGPYRPTGVRVSPHSWIEGPSALRIGEEWIVFFDRYTKGCYGASSSRDLRTWTDIGDRLKFPAGARHGTVFPVDRSTFEGLEKLK